MRNLATLVLLLGVATSCGGTDPSASGVFPISGFLGRKVRVEVSGDATEWGSSSKLNFGEGITVDTVTVASPTALFADITIADNAPLGLHDVTITGGDNVTLPQSFEVQSPISLSVHGSLAQGSVAVVDVINHDLANPFDTTSTGDGLFTPLEFTNIAVTAGSGVAVQISDVSAFAVSATLLIDTDAQTGAFSLASGPTGMTQSFPLGANLEIAPRTAMPLTAGTAATANQAKAYDSFLYEFTPATTPALARFQVTTTGDGSPRIAVLGPSGHFSDLIGAAADQRVVAKTAGKFYAIMFDLSGEVGTSSVKVGSNMLTIAADTEPGDNTAGGAIACTLPCLVENATLGSSTDQDWFKFTAGAMDGGKKIHVTTMPGDDFTDTVVDVLNAAGATSIDGPSDDQDYHEDFTGTTNLANGTGYTVKIYASPMFDTSQTHYDALIYAQ